jgi:cation diffusion facilitator CzcD-associated flavoprotein CzcO
MNAAEIKTDYLVVGAGAAGMAITDELLTHSNASITIVDRRHAPGGHWIDAPSLRSPWQHRPSIRNGLSGKRYRTNTRRPIQGVVG